MKFARIQNGVVQELFVVPSGLTIGDCFHADVASQFVPVPDGMAVVTGWLYSGGNFSAPPPVVPTVRESITNLAITLGVKEELGIYFTPTGASSPILFRSDADAVGKYNAEWSAIHATPSLRSDGDTMIAADGTPVALSNADCTALVTKALAYIRACAANYTSLHAAIVANPAADISGGWPPNT